MRSKSLQLIAMAAAFLISAVISFNAHGADLGRRYEDPGTSYKPAVVPTASWRGWYAGALFGYGLADTDLSGAGAGSLDAGGVIGGGLLGFNWQSGQVVLSLEGDVLAGGLDDSVTFGANRVNGDVDWLGGVRVRAGVLTDPKTLIFLALGYGWADFDLPMTGPGGGSRSEMFSGLQLGGGAEFKLNTKWSARLDYMHTDLSSETITYPGGAAVAYDADMHQFRGGLVLKF